MVPKSVQLDSKREPHVGSDYDALDVLRRARPHLERILAWYECFSDYACKMDNETADYDARDVRRILEYIEKECGR